MPGSKAVRWRIEQLLGQISLLSLDDYPNPTAWLAVVLPPPLRGASTQPLSRLKNVKGGTRSLPLVCRLPLWN